MNPQQPQANPSMMLPPNLMRGGQTTPGQIFQQNPLSQNMSPSAMGADPSLMQQPQPGSDAGNPTMPQPPGAPGLPGEQSPQISEAQYILNALADRLKHHSKITEKTVSTLSDMIGAGLPVSNDQANAPTA